MTDQARPSTPSRATTLQNALNAKEREADELRKQHLTLIGDLAQEPTSTTLLDRIAAVELAMSKARAAIDALQLAIEEAQRQEAAEQTAALREATKELRARVIESARARKRLAANVDVAGRAFIEAVAAFRDYGRGMAADAANVLQSTQSADTALMNMCGQVLPHAHGTHSIFAAALGDIFKRAAQTFDIAALNDVIVLNHFVVTEGQTFERASEQAVEAIKARL